MGFCAGGSPVNMGWKWLWLAAFSFLLAAAGEPRQLLAEALEQLQVSGAGG